MKKPTQLQYGILTLVLMTSFSLRAGVILTNIFSFNGTNGTLPNVLVPAGSNKFYGVTEAGGPNFTGPENEDVGGIFSITSDGVFSNLFFFEGTNGSGGWYLTPGMDGSFYGETGDTVFKLNADGAMANPHFAALPSGSETFGLVQDHDGTLYGTTRFDGPSDFGTIFKIDTNDVFSTLATFNGTNGANPVSLLLGADNNFYGAAFNGGSNFYGGTLPSGDGLIFRVDRSGNLTNVFLFSFPDLGPSCLVQGSDGDLYGLADGGTNDNGLIFRVTTNGVLVWTFSFNGTNGYIPVWLTAGNDGNFYGVTSHGGTNYTTTGNGSGSGTIFRITPNGSFTSLVQFDGINDDTPASIVQGTDGNLYGTTQGGGAYGQGAVFKLSLPTCPTNRLMLTSVANFNDTNGNGNDFPVLMQANDGMLYGATQYGGNFNLGSIFRSTLSGSITPLVSFNGTNGAYPSAPPVQAADGYLYGTTSAGGPDWNPTNVYGGYGTIYRMDTNGILTTIFSFNGSNGAEAGGLSGWIVGNDGALYGVATTGGPHGDGTVFKFTTNGDFTLLASFNGTNGVYPSSIIQASDGNLYGTTETGGIDNTSGFGTVFQMSPNGQINTLFRFNGTNGWSPSSIVQGSDGCLYGTTAAGGPFYTGGYPNEGYGTVFKVTTNGDFSLLASFDATNGAEPLAGLVEACPGVFFGTANKGGLYPDGPESAPFNSGTFFQVTTNGDLTALFSFGADSLLPSNPWTSLMRASDGNYYGSAQFGASNAVYTGDGIFYPGAIFCIRPVQAPVLQPLAQPGQLNLNWNAWAGYSYNVLFETNLTGSNWNLLSTVAPQTNGMTSFSDPFGPDTQRFYRVVLELP